MGLPLVLVFGLMPWPGACSSPDSATDQVRSDSLRIPPFEFEDQDDRIHRYEGKSEKPVVIMVAHRAGVDSNKAWDHWLTARFGEALLLYRVLDLSGVPGLFRGMAKSRVRKGVDPPGIPILLDWDGRFASLLPLSEGASTILLVNRDGLCAQVLRGSPDDKLEKELARGIEALLEYGNGK
jgi:hypothetical protein